MKFNEKQLKDLLRCEQSQWNSDDLSWFDLELLNNLENRLLDPDSQQKIMTMMAHDQTIMNHYLALKNQTQHAGQTTSGNNFFKGSVWALASVFVVSIVVLLTNQIPLESDSESIKRGTVESLLYPSNQAELTSMPDYFVGPQIKQLSRLELRQEKLIIWQSEWQDTPRYLVPLDVRKMNKTGSFDWQIVTEDNVIAHHGEFNVTE